MATLADYQIGGVLHFGSELRKRRPSKNNIDKLLAFIPVKRWTRRAGAKRAACDGGQQFVTCDGGHVAQIVNVRWIGAFRDRKGDTRKGTCHEDPCSCYRRAGDLPHVC